MRTLLKTDIKFGNSYPGITYLVVEAYLEGQSSKENKDIHVASIQKPGADLGRLSKRSIKGVGKLCSLQEGQEIDAPPLRPLSLYPIGLG